MFILFYNIYWFADCENVLLYSHNMMDTNEKKFSFVKKIIFGKKHDESRILNVKMQNLRVRFIICLKQLLQLTQVKVILRLRYWAMIKILCSSFATPRSECSFAGWRSVPGSSDLEYSKGSRRKPDGIPGHLGPDSGGLPDAGPFTTDTKFHFRRRSRYID